MGLFGSDDGGATRARLDRIEAMLGAIIDHLGIDFDAERAAVEAMPQEVVGLVRSGRKIEAIKVLREQRGIGLAEAKELVDRIPQG
jgi:large subunit ribosomal protein L7/L12